MTISDICIRRPVFTAMLVSAPIVLGLFSIPRLGVDLLPNVDIPVVSVTATLRGASVEEMETTITKPIEENVNTISGIDEIASTTKEGITTVIIQFLLEKDGAVAAQEVEARVRTILRQLPQGMDPPIIDRFDLDAAPIMTLAVSGRRDFREVTELARKRVKEVLETVDGVGSVTLVGGRQRAINVIIDPPRLLKFEPPLTIEDVRQALLRNNQEQPGGRVEQGLSETVLRTMGRLDDPSQFESLIIANRGGQPIRLSDVARVEDSIEEPRSLSRLWINTRDDDNPGDNAVSLIIRKKSGTNTVAVVESVRAKLDKLLPSLPADIAVEAIRDQSRFIKRSIEEVATHLLLGAVLVSASILLFLRDWRTTLIATLAIPTSIVGTFAFMYAMGFTLNNITMLGLILAVGIVIDDAVVVHENIFRHMEEYGKPASEAAGSATREIALAVVATTLSLLVIFIPVIFMGGRVGRFFSSFGFVVGFSVFMSMIISFTMTPMLCSKFLLLPESDSPHSKDSRVWKWIERSYVGALDWSLRHRWVIVVTTVIILASTPLLFMVVGKDFIPRDDQSEFEVTLSMPEGYALERSNTLTKQIEDRLRQLPGVIAMYSVVGDTSGRIGKGEGDVTRATIYCRMLDLAERDYSQFDVMNKARAMLADFPDIVGAVQDVSPFQTTGFRQVLIDLSLSGPEISELGKISEQVVSWMKEQGYYVDVDTSLSLRKPELRIRPDRERLSDLGVSIQAVSSTTNVLVGGEPISTFKEGGEQYDVWLRAEPGFRTDEESIGLLTVPSSKVPSGVVPLNNLVHFEVGQGPNTIERYQRQRQVVVSANLEGKDMSGGIENLRSYIKSLDLPPGYSYEFVGRAKALQETNVGFLFAFLLSFLFMYMILAGQFESFAHPISILAALPLTIPFAVLSLILLRTNLDIYAMFGLFMLFGIVKKNGILQVDYTNHLRRAGMPREEAILEANRTRLRPILMTTVMLVAAMIPMALGQGPGSGSRASMAKVILGGQTLSLVLTLLVTPVAYSMLDDAGRWVRGLFRRSKELAPAETISADSAISSAGPLP
ncbi:efflux RND transporter permease subunit [bacterium]|nr:efflux RND transporter permease subunit [bacterium]